MVRVMECNSRAHILISSSSEQYAATFITKKISFKVLKFLGFAYFLYGLA